MVIICMYVVCSINIYCNIWCASSATTVCTPVQYSMLLAFLYACCLLEKDQEASQKKRKSHRNSCFDDIPGSLWNRYNHKHGRGRINSYLSSWLSALGNSALGTPPNT